MYTMFDKDLFKKALFAGSVAAVCIYVLSTKAKIEKIDDMLWDIKFAQDRLNRSLVRGLKDL